MRTRLPALLAILSLASGPSGCVLKRTPNARFFALRSVAEATAEQAAPADAILVGVLPVLLPGHLERPQVVTWAGPGEVRIDEFLRWAEPLDAAVGRVVAENLGSLLPTHRVIRAPWPGATPLRCRVRLELARFGPQANGDVALAVRWILLPERSERPYVARSWSARRTPVRTTQTDADVSAAIEAMSGLLADLSREIAAAIVALPEPAPR